MIMETLSNNICKHCGTVISNKENSCPKCGEPVCPLKINEHDDVKVNESQGIKSQSVKTDRIIPHHDSENPTGVHEIEQLVIDFVKNGSDDLSLYIDNLVCDFKNNVKVNKLFYRGLTESDKGKLQSPYIGPSPFPREGRYNKKGEQCLYLIDDDKFLSAELNSSNLLVQEYHIPTDIFKKIAYLPSCNKELDDMLAKAFAMAEGEKTSCGFDIERGLEKRNRSKYSFSQLLASIFKEYKWDGLYIPGVHGGKGKFYSNLVIFDSICEQWEDWVKGKYYPKCY